LDILDYIRFRAVSDIGSREGGDFEVTFNIEHSSTPGFSEPRRGVMTINLSWLIAEARDEGSVQNALAALVGRVFMRVREEDKEISIHHIHGMPIRDWLLDRIKPS